MVIATKKAIYEENPQKYTSTPSNDNDIDRFNGFPLVSNSKQTNWYGDAYNTLFGRDNRNTDEANQEIIFQLVFSDDPNGTGMIANGAVNSFYGNQRSSTGLVAPSDFIYSQIEIATKERRVYNYKNKMLDARIYINQTYNGSSSSNSNKAIHKYTTRTIDISASGGTTPEASYDSKYTENQNGSNWIIYRLSDIMLMKAEALTQMIQEGDNTEASDYNRSLLDRAFTLVNAVNKRSICQTLLQDTLVRSEFSNKGDMEDLILQERQRELMFEGKRWFDLVRVSQRNGNTTILKNAALQKATTGSGLISNHLSKMDAIYWPYNLDEIKVNKNLVQNPAFSSGEDESYKKTTK